MPDMNKLMNNFLYLFAFVVGLIIPLQAAVNNQLRISMGLSPVVTAFVSFLIGTVVLLIITLTTGQKVDQLFTQQISWWKLTGGAMGALFVFGSIILAPKIGMAGMISLIIAGQMFSSLIFDKFGLFGLVVREISWPRIIGVLLVITGVVLVNFADQLFKSK